MTTSLSRGPNLPSSLIVYPGLGVDLGPGRVRSKYVIQKLKVPPLSRRVPLLLFWFLFS